MLRKWFCKHKWIEVETYERMNFDGFYIGRTDYVSVVCPKCKSIRHMPKREYILEVKIEDIIFNYKEEM
ncbi:MAG: hypothetical protein ACRCX2_20080 [Paraclostridium sp.]